MKGYVYFVLGLVLVIFSGLGFITKKNLGIAGTVSSPGETNCSFCHTPNTAVSGTTISAIPAFTSNLYTPGQTYTIQVNVGCLTLSNFGFACEVLSASNTDTGVMQNPQAGVQFSVAANGRKNATQTGKKAGAGFATFQFEWVAPGGGQVKIYAAGTAVNNNGLTSGDAVSTSSLALTASTVSAVSEINSYFTSVNFCPNPIKSDFTLNYHLEKSGMIKVTLYDLQGKEITEFVNEDQVNGLHTSKASLPTDLSKGVYIMKFLFNGHPDAQRMVIVQ